MFLPADVFRGVVETTPLVSIDLVVENPCGEVLLGLRKNRPAQGVWFVPGGRIHKNELLDAAFARLASSELGLEVSRASARFLGVYEHLYNDSVFGEVPDTHYVVLGYHLRLDLGLNHLPTLQHQDYRWWPQAEMVVSEQVHDNSKAYLPALQTKPAVE